MKNSQIFHNEKNCWWMLVLLACMIFLSGCTNVKKHLSSPDDSKTIQTEIYQENHIIMKYPQIGNETIDLLLKDAAFGVLKYYDTDDKQELSELLIDIDYSVETFDDKVLSVVFYGTGQISEDFHRVNRYKYSINVDMKTGKKLRLSEFVDINEDFVSIFRSALRDQFDEQYRELFDSQSDEELLENLLTSDGLDKNSAVEEQKDIFSYISNEEIYIIYPMPHAAGSYITVKL